MNIYKISQSVNENYDVFDSSVVIASNKDEAREMVPNHEGYSLFDDSDKWEKRSWCDDLGDVVVEYIGEAMIGSERQVVVASFNAG